MCVQVLDNRNNPFLFLRSSPQCNSSLDAELACRCKDLLKLRQDYITEMESSWIQKLLEKIDFYLESDPKIRSWK